MSAAYAATVRAQVAILTTLHTQIKAMEQQVEAHFGQHPDAEVYLSQPGFGAGVLLSASPPRAKAIGREPIDRITS